MADREGFGFALGGQGWVEEAGEDTLCVGIDVVSLEGGRGSNCAVVRGWMGGKGWVAKETRR